jgi:N-acetylneuraminate synthase
MNKKSGLQTVAVGDRLVGEGQPVYIIAEIGINHNGDLEIAKGLIDMAAEAGCDAVKFQKRTPELCVPEEQRGLMRETPWGYMSYMEYKKRIEFTSIEYDQIAEYCRKKQIHWFASSWDEVSLHFMEQYDPPCHKIASASLTDLELLRAHSSTGRALILSTGMSRLEEIDRAVNILSNDSNLLIAQSTSLYPCPVDKLNLRVIPELHDRYEVPVGYSGHETGLSPTYAAVALGASFIERHITLDRAMWGTDQSASVEGSGLKQLVGNIRVIERALGTGEKRVYEEEKESIKRLRNIQ